MMGTIFQLVQLALLAHTMPLSTIYRGTVLAIVGLLLGHLIGYIVG